MGHIHRSSRLDPHHAALPPVHQCQSAPVKNKHPTGLGPTGDTGLPGWFVQGHDLGGHFQDFVQYLKQRSGGISVSSSLMSMCLQLPSRRAMWGAKILSYGFGGKRGAQGAPKKPVPCPHHPGMLSRESCGTWGRRNHRRAPVLGLMFLDGSTKATISSSASVNQP